MVSPEARSYAFNLVGVSDRNFESICEAFDYGQRDIMSLSDIKTYAAANCDGTLSHYNHLRNAVSSGYQFSASRRK